MTRVRPSSLSPLKGCLIPPPATRILSRYRYVDSSYVSADRLSMADLRRGDHQAVTTGPGSGARGRRKVPIWTCREGGRCVQPEWKVPSAVGWPGKKHADAVPVRVGQGPLRGVSHKGALPLRGTNAPGVWWWRAPYGTPEAERDRGHPERIGVGPRVEADLSGSLRAGHDLKGRKGLSPKRRRMP